MPPRCPSHHTTPNAQAILIFGTRICIPRAYPASRPFYVYRSFTYVKEDSNEIIENKINCKKKIHTSVNNRIKSETKGIENNNEEESKPKFGGKIKLKSEKENSKTVVGRNPNDFTPIPNDSNLFQKAKNVQNRKTNPYKEIPSLFSIPTHNRFQILENPTLQTQDSNENRKDKETIMTGISYDSELPEELKNDLIKRLESRKTHISNETTEIRNKNS